MSARLSFHALHTQLPVVIAKCAHKCVYYYDGFLILHYVRTYIASYSHTKRNEVLVHVRNWTIKLDNKVITVIKEAHKLPENTT